MSISVSASLPLLLLCGMFLASSGAVGPDHGRPAERNAAGAAEAEDRTAAGTQATERGAARAGASGGQKTAARGSTARPDTRTEAAAKAAGRHHCRSCAPADARPGRAAENRDRHQGFRHQSALAALRSTPLGRSEPARRPRHPLSDRMGLQTPRTPGGDRARIRGLAAGAGPRRDQGLGALGDAHRPAQLHRHRRRCHAPAGRAGQLPHRWRF